MSARISPQSDVIQGEGADGNAQNVVVGTRGALTTDDRDVKQLLITISTTLKKIEYHLYLATDTHLNDEDVGG